MKRFLLTLVAVGSLGGTVARCAEATTLSSTRSALEQWVQTRRLVARARSDWQADKESLEQTVQLYQRELKAIDEQVSKVSTNNSQVEKEMAEAEALRKLSNESLDNTRQFAAGFEVRVKQLAPRLPLPMQEILKSLIARLPVDPSNTKMLAAERVQALVGVLNELDKFNNAVNLFNEKRKNPKGDEVAVQTIYVGLGAAYFVNEAVDFAGTGTPGPNGWEWIVKSEIAPSVQEVVKIYRTEKAARFVTLPVAVH